MSKVTPYPLRIVKCAKGALHKSAQKKPVSKKPLHPLLKGKRGDGFPLTIAVTLCLILIFCGISEYFRVSIIAKGVRDAVKQSVISTVNDNFDDVYHSVREGYAAGYFPTDDESWEESLDTGNIYAQLALTLGLTATGDGYPDGDSQLAWVKWHTPDEPCVITISVSVSGSGWAQNTVVCNIIDLDGNDPPNPIATDRNDAYTASAVPTNAEVTSASWGIWSPWWQEYWEWVPVWVKCWHTDRWTDADGKNHSERWYHWVDNGYWEDHGWWMFDYDSYTATLTASMSITPDDKSPTATASTTKSGYGVQQSVTARVRTDQSAAITAAQNAVTYFPEFGYATYWRLLDRTITGKSSEFEFKTNRYSTYNRRTHFTPIWFPDGAYTPYTWLLDCWTPAGMLSMNLTDSVTIRGNLWEEWHIAPANP